MATWFGTFNHAYFDDRLPLPRLVVSRSRTRLGSMSCKRRLKGFRMRNTDYAIHLSNYYELSERQFQNVLLHEMIHYFIAYSGQRDRSAHGPLFRAWMTRLNHEHGWEITVTSNMKAVEVSEKVRRPSQYIVLALCLKDGRHLLSRVSPRYVQALERRLEHAGEVERHGWYVSRNSLFFSMPAVRSLRGRIVGQDEYERIVDESDPLQL